MYPNQQYPRPGGGANPPYPQQPGYGVAGGLAGGFQPNMSAPYGNNQGGYGGAGNPYAQGAGYPSQGSTYPGQQSGYPGQGSAYPGQQSGYPGQGSAYPGQQSGYPSQGSAYPGQQSGYPGQGSAYPGQQSGYPGQGSAYPGQQSGYPGQGSAYPGQQSGYPGQSSAYPGQQSGYPGQSSAFPGQQSGYPGQGSDYPGQQSGYPSQSGGPGGFGSNDPRAQRLNQIVQQYEINQQFAARLYGLANCEIVVLCDDSGSMNTPLQGSNQTRWDELKNLVNIVVDISAVMDSNGVDVYFLNREPLLNVTNAQTIRHAFNSPPQGLTPLVPAIRRIIASKRSQAYEKKLLILIATDGAPTNEYGQTDIGSLEHVLRTERTPQTYVTFLACTDDLEAVSYLSNWDKSMPNLDVIDDYRSERAEIQRTRGNNFPFSFGDYIVKALLGSIDPWFDSLDERA